MNITAVGIDLAKNVFQVHAVDARGKVVLRKQLRRARMAGFFSNMSPCLIGMEACASAHHWGRTFERFGHKFDSVLHPHELIHRHQAVVQVKHDP